MLKRLLPLAFALLAAAAHADGHDTCTVDTPNIDFGTYLAGQAEHLDASGTVVLDCDKKKLDVMITIGAGTSGNVNLRSLARGTSRLRYQLYADPARTAVWATRYVVTDKNARRVDTIAVYARVFANQDVLPGTYLDALTVTVLP